MECKTFLEQISNLPTTPPSPDAVAHASGCASCRKLLEAEKRIDKGFKLLARLPEGRDLVPQIMARVKAVPAAPTETGPLSHLQRWLPSGLPLNVGVVLAICAGLMIGVGVFRARTISPVDSGKPRHVSSASETPRTSVTMPAPTLPATPDTPRDGKAPAVRHNTASSAAVTFIPVGTGLVASDSASSVIVVPPAGPADRE
ncbi:MAG: hypothetical protein HQM09_14955 [Candidatus Riflebacteria bacterium]|nr:hypothetical protein [Candidatus Riflebacteria bacterium]